MEERVSNSQYDLYKITATRGGQKCSSDTQLIAYFCYKNHMNLNGHNTKPANVGA